MRNTLVWTVLAIVIAVPLTAATQSKLLAWRDTVYIIAGFAGIIALALLLVQPLLAAGFLPNLSAKNTRRAHRWVGFSLICMVVIHVVTLWITSPPDVVDALLLASPTPFSIWGVIAMWAVFASGFLVTFRHRLKLSPRNWRRVHTALVVVIVLGSIVHALLVEGAMETVSKVLLCMLVFTAMVTAIIRLKVWMK